MPNEAKQCREHGQDNEREESCKRKILFLLLLLLLLLLLIIIIRVYIHS